MLDPLTTRRPSTDRRQARRSQTATSAAGAARRARTSRGRRRPLARRARRCARGRLPLAPAPLEQAADGSGCHGARHPLPARPCALMARRAANRPATTRRSGDRLSLPRVPGDDVRPSARVRSRLFAQLGGLVNARHDRGGERRGPEAGRVPRWGRALQGRARRPLRAARARSGWPRGHARAFVKPSSARFGCASG